jgi:thiamine-phosphate pyrophosphorylase
VALRLNRRNAPHLPPLFLVTDDSRLPDPFEAAQLLPEGSGILLRHRDATERAGLSEALMALAKQRGFLLVVAEDVALAHRLEADGVHFPEAKLSDAVLCRRRYPLLGITIAAHSERALFAAARAGADAAFLAPVFPTLSHPGKRVIGPQRLRVIAGRAPLPVYALGGISGGNAAQLSGLRLAGVAAIEGLLPDES